MWGPTNALLEENLSSDQQGLTPYCLKMEDEEKVEIEQTMSASTFVEPSFPLQEKVGESLVPIASMDNTKKMREDIDRYGGGLELFSHGYEKLGFMHRYHTF
ncbi:hypothetical protein Patl1_28086 [Pistacia atlantica]|uniref:Uncharacterized protein n=1 Tax=Pistacia atlantica TaxID=434234 RepID=A0ACC1BBK8_9ROSI|nr:hypothetical protein Patl1_28086 [Pistacia atlantica]